MKKLLIATRNNNKLSEIKPLFAGMGFELINLNDISNISDDFTVEENGKTFEENATIKAVGYGKIAKILTLAEDSGICVDALGGKPGVLSARFFPGADKDRNQKVLDELKNVPGGKRNASYKAVIAIFDPNTNTTSICEGVWRGTITTEPIGENGFGYDPIFFCPEFGKTAAQLTTEEKNSVSHRAKALSEAKKALVRLVPAQ